MVDIQIYRIRIGCFSPMNFRNRALSNQKVGLDKMKNINTSWQIFIICTLVTILSCSSRIQVFGKQKLSTYSYGFGYTEQTSIDNLATKMSFSSQLW